MAGPHHSPRSIGKEEKSVSKQQVISDFLSMLHEENVNKVQADNGYEEAFGTDKLFSIICNKCGSADIEIIGERGIDYGGQTGYSPGSTAIKCNGCGSALTVWE
jgi:ribosomal protein S27E